MTLLVRLAVVLSLVGGAVPQMPGPSAIAQELVHRDRMVLEGPKGGIWSVAFSPDGKLTATAAGDKKVRLYAASSGKLLLTLDGPGPFFSVAFSPDSKTLPAR